MATDDDAKHKPSPANEARTRHEALDALSLKLIFALGGILVLWVVISGVIYTNYTIADWGAFGDSMAPVAALGVVFALILNTYSNSLQAEDVAAQLNEMQATKEAQEELAREQKRANDLAEEANAAEYLRLELEQNNLLLEEVRRLEDDLGRLHAEIAGIMKTTGGNQKFEGKVAPQLDNARRELGGARTTAEDWRQQALLNAASVESRVKRAAEKLKNTLPSLVMAEREVRSARTIAHNDLLSVRLTREP